RQQHVAVQQYNSVRCPGDPATSVYTGAFLMIAVQPASDLSWWRDSSPIQAKTSITGPGQPPGTSEDHNDWLVPESGWRGGGEGGPQVDQISSGIKGHPEELFKNPCGKQGPPSRLVQSLDGSRLLPTCNNREWFSTPATVADYRLEAVQCGTLLYVAYVPPTHAVVNGFNTIPTEEIHTMNSEARRGVSRSQSSNNYC
ncbi:hypothetical protein BaRGS_00022174, partial [Batillaria attramentaria]